MTSGDQRNTFYEAIKFFSADRRIFQLAQENPLAALGEQSSMFPPATRVALNRRFTFFPPQSGQETDLSLLLKISFSKSMLHFSQ
jgi:hypothetical protein